MPRFEIAIAAIPKGVDEVTDALRELGRTAKTSIQESEQAEKGLHGRSAVLTKLMGEQREAIHRADAALRDLSDQYTRANAEARNYEGQLGPLYDELARIQDLKRDKLIHQDDKSEQIILAQIDHLKAMRKHWMDVGHAAEEAIGRQRTALQTAEGELKGLTGQARHMGDTLEWIKGNRGLDSVAQGFRNTQRAANGANQAVIAFRRLLSGNLVGAFRSATMASRNLWAAFVGGSEAATFAVGGLLATVTALYYAHKKNVQAEEEYAERLKKTHALVSENFAARKAALGDMGDTDLEKHAQRLRNRAYDASMEAMGDLQMSNYTAATAGTLGWIGFVGGADKAADKALAKAEESAKRAKAIRDELAQVEEEIKRRSKAAEEARSREAGRRADEALEAIRKRQEERNAEEAFSWEERLSDIEATEGKLKRIAIEEQRIRANGGSDGKLSIEDRRRLRQLSLERDAENERLRKERDSEAMKDMSLVEKRAYLQEQIKRRQNLLASTGKISDENVLKDYRAQLSAVENSIKQIGETRKEQATEYRRNRAFEKKSESEKLEYLQKEAGFLRSRMAAEKDPEKRGKIWDRLFANRQTYNDILDAQKKEQYKDSPVGAWENRNATAADRLAMLRAKIESAAKSGNKYELYNSLLEANELVGGIRQQNMTWVDRKKAARAARRQARADRDAAEEMGELIDAIDGGGSDTSLGARSARRMGGDLRGFARHPNGMAARSARRIAAMRAGTLGMKEPGFPGVSTGKSQEATGIERSNELLQHILDSLK